MALISISVVLLAGGILCYIFTHRKKRTGNKPAAYVCHSCGEHDCICHRDPTDTD